MLTIDRVCKSFGSLSVLKDVSLTVGDGEIVALIGPSGCGKTTLLDIISGLSQPDRNRRREHQLYVPKRKTASVENGV